MLVPADRPGVVKSRLAGGNERLEHQDCGLRPPYGRLTWLADSLRVEIVRLEVGLDRPGGIDGCLGEATERPDILEDCRGQHRGLPGVRIDPPGEGFTATEVRSDRPGMVSRGRSSTAPRSFIRGNRFPMRIPLSPS